LLAAIAVLFVATLPFTGLEPLWGTRSAATVLMALVLAMVVFANAVHQDGDGPPPYPRPLRLLASAGLVVLPVFAVLALVALGLRVAQYGWTVDRLWGVLAASVLAVHAFGYAWAALSRKGPWLPRMEPVNATAALGGVVLVLRANAPVLDPQRIAARSQVERLLDGKTDPADFDVDYLRFQSGRAGYQALAGIVDEPRIQDDAELAGRIERALARQQHWLPWVDVEPMIDTVEQARALVATPAAVPGDWWPALLSEDPLESIGCLQPGSDCVAIARDLDGDGAADVLLCNLAGSWAAHCQLHARDADGAGSAIAQVGLPDGPTGRVAEARRRGEVETMHRHWPDLEIGGARATIEARCSRRLPGPPAASPSAAVGTPIQPGPGATQRTHPARVHQHPGVVGRRRGAPEAGLQLDHLGQVAAQQLPAEAAARQPPRHGQRGGEVDHLR